MRKSKVLKWPKNLQSRRYKCTVGHAKNDVPNLKSVKPWRPSKGMSPKVQSSVSPMRKKTKVVLSELLESESEEDEETVAPSDFA